MGILDEKFHTLISPRDLGPENFWAVVDAYTRAYLALISEMIADKSIENKYKWILENPIDAYDSIIEFCRKNANKESYYKVIKELKDKYDFKIITTNYTPLVDEITGLRKQVAHVHGKLNWFESPREWKVYDIKCYKNNLKIKLPEDEILFPYIFIQSGIKPIVEEKIIKKYNRAIRYFYKVQKLIILGYRINYDDNHINSIIRNRIVSRKKVIYLKYDKNVTDEDLFNRLRLDKNQYKDDLIIKCISDENSISIFKEAIEL